MMFTINDCTVNAMHGQGADERALRAVWDEVPPLRRGPRARFEIVDVAAAAVALADRGGLSAVALAALAHELGLTTTALYRYVDSKETLVQLMVDAAVGPAPRVVADDWRDGVLAWVQGLWGRYRAHPWLATAPVSGMPLYPQRLGWMEVLLRELDRGQVDDPMRVALLLDGLTRSFALLARQDGEGEPPPAWVLEAVTRRYPRLAQEISRDWTDIADELAPAVRTVLAGAV